jgi:hypothetical protein
LTPTSSSSVDSLTPVHSAQLTMPWLNCSEFICAARQFMPPLAGHSMKWMRVICGKRRMSFMVSSSGRSTSPVDHQLVLRRIDVGPARMVALEEQSIGRDDAVQVLQRRKAHRRFRAGGEPGDVAPDHGGFGIRRPAIGPVDHARADRLRPGGVGGRRLGAGSAMAVLPPRARLPVSARRG